MDPAAQAAALTPAALQWRQARRVLPRCARGVAMKIPDNIRIPVLVLTLLAAMAAGWLLILFVILPER
jgi:hypothetical protein